MACDVSTLLEDACTNGFSCIPTLRHYDIAIAQLLCEIKDAIEAGGGGGTTCCNVSGVGSPVGVTTPTVVNQFYRDTVGNTLWQSTGLTNLNWMQWI